MKTFAFLMQIGELFEGRFNWPGVLALFFFFLMGIVAAGFSGFIIYKALFSSKKK